MPRSSCDACCNPIELARGQDTWRAAVLIILCAILEALDGTIPEETPELPEV